MKHERKASAAGGDPTTRGAANRKEVSSATARGLEVIDTPPATNALRKRRNVHLDPDVAAAVRIIESCVAEEFAVTLAELRARRRQRSHTRARHVAMLLARQLLPDASVPQIALALDRDHSTMVYALETLDAAMRRDPVLVDRVNRLKRKLVPLIAAPRSMNGKLATHLARDIGRELGRGIGEEIGDRVATALQPLLYAMLTHSERSVP